MLMRENHTFSAKEKDAETGLSVTSLRSVSSSSLSQAQTSLTWRSLIRRFGSRYYSSDLSIWLSVDPMSDKYPSLSPYTYCANNPIKLVDPNGEEVWIVGSDWESAFNSLQQGTNLELSIKNGVVEIVGGKVLNDNDQQLYDAINDNSVIAKINASDEMPNPDGGKRPFSIQRPNNTTITGSYCCYSFSK